MTRSKLWLTHDIDAVNTGWLQDIRATRGLWWRPWVYGSKHWATFDTIMDIEARHEMSSTFLFLPVRDKDNADYSMEQMAPYIERIRARGWDLGLHRSLADIPIEVELARLPYKPSSVRYHHLNVRENGELVRCGIRVEGSDETLRAPWTSPRSRVTHTGLHIHDTRFVRDRRLPPDVAKDEVARILRERTSEPLTVVLWHNSMWSAKYNYGGVYEYLLETASSLGYESVGPEWITEQFTTAG